MAQTHALLARPQSLPRLHWRRATPLPRHCPSSCGPITSARAAAAASTSPDWSKSNAGFQTPSGLYIPSPGSTSGTSPSQGSSPAAPYLPFLRSPSPSQQQQHSAEELLEILRDRRGLWYEYAPHIQTLCRLGMSPSAIAEITGIEGGEQSTMVVAAQVLSALRDQGCPVLDFFDQGGAELLYELRVLSGGRRKDAATFVVEQRLDGKGAKEVAKAMKEYERRKQEEGWGSFSASPADCLAFAYYRQSKEVKGQAEVVALLEKGLHHAETESAKQKIQQALERAMGQSSEAPPEDDILSKVPTVRLRTDETFPMPIPIFGDIACLSPETFSAAVKSTGVVRGDGPFATFSPSQGSSWLCVPSWPALAMASGAVAGVLVQNTNGVPWLSRRQIPGPLVLVVDLGEAALAESGRSTIFLCRDGDALSVSPSAVPEDRLGKLLAAILPPKPDDGTDEFELDD